MVRIFVTGASGWIGSPKSCNSWSRVTRSLGWHDRMRRQRRCRPPVPRCCAAAWMTWTSCGTRPQPPTVFSTSRSGTTLRSAATSRRPSRPTVARSRHSVLRSRAPTDRWSSPPARWGWHPGGWALSWIDRTRASIPGIANAHLALSLADRGVRSSMIRYAPTVHGHGDHGFIATLVEIARTRQVAGYLGDGSNRWPAVHRSDAATFTRLVVEKAQAGSVWHATAEEGVRTRDIADHWPPVGRPRRVHSSGAGGSFRISGGLHRGGCACLQCPHARTSRLGTHRTCSVGGLGRRCLHAERTSTPGQELAVFRMQKADRSGRTIPPSSHSPIGGDDPWRSSRGSFDVVLALQPAAVKRPRPAERDCRYEVRPRIHCRRSARREVRSPLLANGSEMRPTLAG